MSSYGLVHTERLRDELLHLFSFERIEPPHGKAAETQERLLRAAQGDVRIPLGFVVCPEKNNSLARDLSRDEVQQLERRRVSPLKILESPMKVRFVVGLARMPRESRFRTWTRDWRSVTLRAANQKAAQ